jgi:hypothetical protein
MRIRLAVLLLLGGLVWLGIACGSEQIRAVRKFNEEASLIQIACLDVNHDGVVDGADADPTALPDLTGDGAVLEDDLALLGEVQFTLGDDRPADCQGGRGSHADWQTSAPPDLNCEGGQRGLLLLAVGGGAANLAELDNAAGTRWMVEELSDDLGVPVQIASVAPWFTGTSAPQPNAERWASVVLAQRAREQPCLQMVLLGHSHGGALATAVASRLEEAGLGSQILMTVLVDRTIYLYGGDTTSLPQSSPVFNVYLGTSAEATAGKSIDQPNVENWDASGVEAPERGEEGGALRPANHTTVDNSEEVLEQVRARLLVALAVR